MGINFKGVVSALKVAALFEPHVAIVAKLITAAEGAMAGAKGADKKAAVVEVSDAALVASAPWLTAAEIQAVKDARSAWIDVAVAAEKAIAAEKAARKQLESLIATFRAPVAASDGTGHP
jgi:hypothetical protein